MWINYNVSHATHGDALDKTLIKFISIPFIRNLNKLWGSGFWSALVSNYFNSTGSYNSLISDLPPKVVKKSKDTKDTLRRCVENLFNRRYGITNSWCTMYTYSLWIQVNLLVIQQQGYLTKESRNMAYQ